MEAKRGVVSTVSAKPWFDTRQGSEVVLHSFQLQGDRGWYRTGTKQEVREGDYIEFVVGDKNTAKDIRKVDKPAGAAPAARAAPAVGGGRDGYWEAKEARDLEKDRRYQEVDVPRIVYQASQERAIALLDLALRTESITLPAKKSDRLDALVNIADELAQDLACRAMVAHETLAGRGKDGALTADAAAPVVGDDE